MNAFNFGSPNLFVKGLAEITVIDPATGNIIAYDNVASDSAVTSSVNMGEITGGLNNPLQLNIPDTTRITGTLTSQAFSLRQRALATGGTIGYNAITRVCETITASSAALTVTKTPAKAYGQPASDTYGWAWVREHGAAEYSGQNYGVDLTSKTIRNFNAVSGKSYDVTYFTSLVSAQVLPIPANFNPKVVTNMLKYGVYAKQGDSVANSSLYGWLYFVVPRAQFTGDIGIAANQTTNATTDYAWTALMPDEGIMGCDDCGASGSNYAYYVFVPCGDTNQAVSGLAVIGGAVTVSLSGASGTPTSAQIPVVYIMPDDTIVTPTYTDMTYTVTSGATMADVSESGLVTGKIVGNATVKIELEREGLATLETTCDVTVIQ